MECSSGCGRPLSEQSLRCRLCKQLYHCECLNINSQQYSALTKEYLASWQCPSCCNVSRRHKGNRDNTPVRNSVIPTPEDTSVPGKPLERATYPDCDWRVFTQELQSTLNTWRQDMDNNLAKIRREIHNALSDIKQEIHALRTEQDGIKSGLASLTRDITELKSSSQYQAEQHGDLERKVRDLESVTSGARDAVNLISALEYKIDGLEQQARQCNVEICNVPDRRNENLLGILEAIGSKIKYPIQQKDIVSVHRVPHASQQSDRPKNIIVKFTTRILRDNILSAFRKAKGVKSDELGIAGQSHAIYMNEHLTLKKKQLFRECRDKAKECKYKYVWIKNGAILVRQDDNKPAFVIHSNQNLDKIRSSSAIQT